MLSLVVENSVWLVLGPKYTVVHWFVVLILIQYNLR